MPDYSKNKSSSHGSRIQSKSLPEFSLEPVSAELFSDTAKELAIVIAENGRNDKGKNKSTQLRRFYDEVCLWQEKVGHDESKFKENLPFIKMIAAKAAYANGRNLVDDSYLSFIEKGLKQVDSLQKFNTFKTFMEAFMGFYKCERRD